MAKGRDLPIPCLRGNLCCRDRIRLGLLLGTTLCPGTFARKGSCDTMGGASSREYLSCQQRSFPTSLPPKFLPPSSAPSAPSGCPAPVLKRVTGGLEREGQELAHTLTLAWVRCVLSPRPAHLTTLRLFPHLKRRNSSLVHTYFVSVQSKLAAALDQAPTQEHIRDFL